MLDQRRIIDLRIQRQVDLPGQQQVVQRQLDVQQIPIAQVALEGQVDIRAGAVVALGAGAVEHRLLDARKAAEHLADGFDDLRREADFLGYQRTAEALRNLLDRGMARVIKLA